jgi:hypothetical protein
MTAAIQYSKDSYINLSTPKSVRLIHKILTCLKYLQQFQNAGLKILIQVCYNITIIIYHKCNI